MWVIPKAFFLISLMLLAPPALAANSARNQAGVFDYYVLNLSWVPEFCHARAHVTSPECHGVRRGFTVHGLWPQFHQGYPEYCSREAELSDPSRMLDIMPTPQLVQHEWYAHGTCSGLGADAYFDTMRRARVALNIPPELQRPTHGLLMTPRLVKQAFVTANPTLRSEDIIVGCSNSYLTSVEICLSRDVVKPQACENLPDCRATALRVAPVRE